MYDAHAHLNFSPLLEQVDEIVEKSRAAGLTGIIIASSNVSESKVAVKLAQEYPGFLFASTGIHPQDTRPKDSQTVEDQLKQLDQICQDNHVVAIGETGLDFSPAPPGERDRPPQEQKELFLGQIKLAQKHNLPLMIHAREAYDEVINLLSNVSDDKLVGVFHCYAGGRKRIEKILNLPGEWYFGFDGNLTYDQGLQSIIKQIPIERLLIETDAPFLAPTPYRGQSNYPYYLPLVQDKINELFGQDLTGQIAKNSHRLFKIVN